MSGALRPTRPLSLILALLGAVTAVTTARLSQAQQVERLPDFGVPVASQDDGAAIVQNPYSIPDTILAKFSWNSSDSISLVVFSGTTNTEQQEQSIQLNRIFTEFPTDNFKVILITVTNRTEQSELENVRVIRPHGQHDSSVKSCVFLL